MRKHKIAEIEIDKCFLLERNPQYLTPKQMDSLKKSIERDGFVVPILVKPEKSKYRIISGNHRFMAAQELGYKTVPAVVAKLSDRECKRLSINLNLIHGEPEAEQLAPFLADFDKELLSEIHLEKGLLDAVISFDLELKDKLKDFDVPDSINTDCVKTEVATCVCPKCGKKHIKSSSAE